jgi:hypothetical protein
VITPAQLEKFEMWFREYFDPEVPELPDPKYLALWAEKHGEDLLALLKAAIMVPICPSCNHPRCEARCDLNADPMSSYVPGRACPSTSSRSTLW